jgi:hypothetical protein
MNLRVLSSCMGMTWTVGPLSLAGAVDAHADQRDEKLKQLRALRANRGVASASEVRRLDFVLSKALHMNLDRFLPATDGVLPPGSTIFTRPLLVLGLDQGSQGAAAANFLQSRVRCWVHFDPCHRLWNDAQDGIRAAKLWGPSLSLL